MQFPTGSTKKSLNVQYECKSSMMTSPPTRRPHRKKKPSPESNKAKNVSAHSLSRVSGTSWAMHVVLEPMAATSVKGLSRTAATFMETKVLETIKLPVF